MEQICIVHLTVIAYFSRRHSMYIDDERSRNKKRQVTTPSFFLRHGEKNVLLKLGTIEFKAE